MEEIAIASLPFDEAVELVMKLHGMDRSQASQLVAIEQGLINGDLTETDA